MNKPQSDILSIQIHPQKITISFMPFTGKERDEETSYGYFGARYMDHELMTMWLSVDPMADKYPSLSPYAYCAWNPVKLVDPDGMDIWINDGGKNYYYKQGHVYIDKKHTKLAMDSKLSRYGQQILSSLNEISGNSAGEVVMDKLQKDNCKFTINHTTPRKQNPNDITAVGGGYLNNNITLYDGKISLSSLSHELFHAYQSTFGHTPHTIFNEVEAYVFQAIISGNDFGITSNSNQKFNEMGAKLRKGFDGEAFNYLVANFQSCSKANEGHNYDSKGMHPYWVNPANYKRSDSCLNNKKMYK